MMKIQYSGYQTSSPAKLQDPLTGEQKKTLQEILSNYKPENFSSQDQIALSQNLKEAGIPKTMEVEKMIREKGFPVRTFLPNSGIPDNADQQNDQLITPQIISLFKLHDAGELTDTEFHVQLEQVKQNYSKSSGNLINRPV
jgi:hypothetical protein